MASNEQSVTLLRKNKRAQIDALNSLGFSLTEGARASEFPQLVKWASGFLDATVAAVRKSDGKNFYFTVDEWKSLSATEQGLFLLRGVRVRACATSFIIAADTIQNKTWGSNKTVSDCHSFSGGVGLYTYFNAYEETKIIAAAYENVSANGVIGAPAAEAALAYKAFNADADGMDDTSQWCLPTAAHLMIMFRFATEINSVFIAVWSNDYILQQIKHWSCCQWDSSSAYRQYLSSGSMYVDGKTTTGAVRPICLS
jgi:hypothetical protein